MNGACCIWLWYFLFGSKGPFSWLVTWLEGWQAGILALVGLHCVHIPHKGTHNYGACIFFGMLNREFPVTGWPRIPRSSPKAIILHTSNPKP